MDGTGRIYPLRERFLQRFEKAWRRLQRSKVKTPPAASDE
jgi:hypothetical protein